MEKTGIKDAFIPLSVWIYQDQWEKVLEATMEKVIPNSDPGWIYPSKQSKCLFPS